MKIKEQAQLVIQDAHDIHLKIVKEIFSDGRTVEEQDKLFAEYMAYLKNVNRMLYDKIRYQENKLQNS